MHRTALAAILVAVPGTAYAHAGPAALSGGFAVGFGHPLGGLDHVLAMVLVGVLAYRLGKHARFALPAAFLLVMAAGGGLGASAIGLGLAAAGIAVSIVVLAGMVALRLTPPIVVAAGLVGAFGGFHGIAHGAEMGAGVSAFGYGAGFLVATALLHMAGLALCALLARRYYFSGQNA